MNIRKYSRKTNNSSFSVLCAIMLLESDKMNDCLFCKIINGDIPCFKVYEDELVLAFLDINPKSNGHTLIIPKKHFENLYEMELEDLKEIEKASQMVGKLLKEKLNCQGITRLQNNEFGQDVKHYHMHLIPRYQGAKFMLQTDKNNLLETQETFEKITQ